MIPVTSETTDRVFVGDRGRPRGRLRSKLRAGVCAGVGGPFGPVPPPSPIGGKGRHPPLAIPEVISVRRNLTNLPHSRNPAEPTPMCRPAGAKSYSLGALRLCSGPHRPNLLAKGKDSAGA
jgi:hypothetical protein